MTENNEDRVVTETHMLMGDPMGHLSICVFVYLYTCVFVYLIENNEGTPVTEMYVDGGPHGASQGFWPRAERYQLTCCAPYYSSTQPLGAVHILCNTIWGGGPPPSITVMILADPM